MSNEGSATSDAERLAGYVAVWWSAVGDFVALLERVPADLWTLPTDLPGWDVRACVAHVAHLERRLAGEPEESADGLSIGEPPHVSGPLGLYTEIGVVNRRAHSPAQLLDEVREATQRRHRQLLAHPPTDAAAHPEHVFGGVPWTWEVLLRNRPLDVWMHEQDVRRAVGLPGGMDSPAARLTTDSLADGFGFVLAKRVGAPPGTTAVLAVVGSSPRAFVVGEDGRGRRLPETPARPTFALTLERETFCLLAGGRRSREQLDDDGALDDAVEGDATLAGTVLDRLATTP